MRYEVRCIYCQEVCRYSEVEGSSGLCQGCYERLTGHAYLHPEQIDRLPFGLIELDDRGTILSYNRAEAELARLRPGDVVGRNFYTEVAPCTAVSEFQGRFNAFMAGGERTMQFDFSFHFEHGETAVKITMLRKQSGSVLLLVEVV